MLNILCNLWLKSIKLLENFIGKKKMDKIAILPIDQINTIKINQLFNEHYTMSFKWREGFDIW